MGEKNKQENPFCHFKFVGISIPPNSSYFAENVHSSHYYPGVF